MNALRTNRGFSLVELMIVVVVTALLAALAAPSFDTLLESQRAKSAATDLYVALTRARSEAVKRNTNVTLSPKSGGWANGWQILDPATNAAIEDHEAIRSGLAISGPDNVVYRSSGRITGSSTASFAITGSTDAAARCVAVDVAGRPNIKAGSC